MTNADGGFQSLVDAVRACAQLASLERAQSVVSALAAARPELVREVVDAAREVVQAIETPDLKGEFPMKALRLHTALAAMEGEGKP